MNVSYLLFGAIMLVAGRRFFWLFVGIVGFLAGMQYAAVWFKGSPEWMVFLIAVAIGLVGAMLAVVAQWIVIIMAGFGGGGYLAIVLTQMFVPAGDVSAIVFLLGGTIGAVVMIAAFDIALILLSSLIGAVTIVEALGLKDTVVATLALIVLAIAGVYLQSNLLSSNDVRKG